MQGSLKKSIRRFARSVVAVGAVLAAVRSGATTFVMLDQDQLAEMSAAVVRGTVSQIVAGQDAASGRIYTDIVISVEDVLRGDYAEGDWTIRERGGRVDGEEEWIFGAPRFQLGENVILFLDDRGDGSWRTTAMALGKFRVLGETLDGDLEIRRDLGEGVQVLDSDLGASDSALDDRVTTLSRAIRQQRRHGPGARHRADMVEPPPLVNSQVRSEFTYLGSSPSRWFEPDWGAPVDFLIDPTGDPGPNLGPAESVGAIRDAFDSWSTVAGSGLNLRDAGVLPSPIAFGGCSGGNRIVFNDPFDEITDPSGCGGVLAIGGFCTSGETTTVNGTSFRRIRVGKVTFNNGWSGCFGWNRCNMSEVATHEIGHAIGLGHSTVSGAVMRSFAYFNGRCSSLGSDDEEAIRFMYPAGASVSTPTPTVIPPTPTRTPTPAATHTPTRTRTWTPTRTRTSTRTRTRTPTRTYTRTWTRAAPPTSTHTLAPTATHTPPPLPTRTPTASATRTRTRTSPPTATASPNSSVHRLSGVVHYFMDGRSVPGADVVISGTSVVADSTDQLGTFDFPAVGEGALEIHAWKSGDVGVAISALDAAYALQAVVGSRDLSPHQRLACDATGDGTVTPLDASRLLQRTLGAISSLPVVDRCGSDWLMVPSSVPGGVATPPSISLAGCSPGSLSLPVVDSDRTDIAFDAVLLGDCSGGWQSSIAANAQASMFGRRARVRLGRLRVRGDVAELPVYVRSGNPYQSLDLEIGFDADQLEPVSLELRRPLPGALVDQRVVEPGKLRVAYASADLVTRRQGVFLKIRFHLEQASLRLSAVRALSARLDEVSVKVSSSARRR